MQPHSYCCAKISCPRAGEKVQRLGALVALALETGFSFKHPFTWIPTACSSSSEGSNALVSDLHSTGALWCSLVHSLVLQ